ncbi:MAG: DM13 domain-containing protein [Bacteroidota bacterium]
MKTNLFLCLMALLLSACVGTDIVELTTEAKVSILTPVETLQVGDTLEMEAEYIDRFGDPQNTPVTWTSLHENIIQIVNSNSLVAVDTGLATIVATVDGVHDSVRIQATPDPTSFNQNRTGIFEGKNNYTVEGSFDLAMTETGLSLDFGTDFLSQRGPGLYIYLGNSGTSIAGAVELGEIKAFTGAQSYAVPAEVELNTFDFVIVYCKPFGASFGCGAIEQ